MPTLSALKNSVLSTLNRPNEGSKLRLGRRVIPFDEALANLKSAKTGVAPCAAFHRFGRCRKGVPLRESDFLANLDQIEMTDVQTPMKLMPLMLCSGHWGKTIYNNSLFLDWLSIYGSKKDNEHFENIVVDCQSAIAIDDEVPSLSNAPLSGDLGVGIQGRPVSAPSSPVKGNFKAELGIPSFVEPFRRVIGSNEFAEGSHMNGSLVPDDSQLIRGHANFVCPDSALDHPLTHVPEISVLMTMESYASIELGAAKLEIIYQDDLKCIAMTSDGWRCQDIVQQDRLLEARRLLNKSLVEDTELDMDLFSFLVLCPGHAQGDLSSIYCDKWTAFAKQRLPKEEAMAKFDAEIWMSVEFFRNDVNDVAFSKKVRRPRSASGLRPRLNLDGGFENDGNTGSNFLPLPSNIPFVFEGSNPGSPSPLSGPEFPSIKISNDSKAFEDKFSFEAESTEYLNIKLVGLRSSRDLTNDLQFQVPRAKATLVLDTSAPHNPPKDDASKLEPEESSSSATGLFSDVRITDIKLQPDFKPSLPLKTFLDERVSVENQTGVHDSQPEILATTTSFKEPALPSIPSRSLEDIHKDVIQKIRPQFSEGGNVYVFKSLDGTLIRIGTVPAIPAMHFPISTVQAQYCTPQALDQVEVENIKVKHFPERVLSLVHLELENFRVQAAYHHGEEGLEQEKEHRQWFKVSERVALQSVRLWRDFVDQAYTPEGNMAEDWEKAYIAIPPPGIYEYESLKSGLKAGSETCLSIHHDLRHKRYESWIRDWEALFVKQRVRWRTDDP